MAGVCHCQLRAGRQRTMLLAGSCIMHAPRPRAGHGGRRPPSLRPAAQLGGRPLPPLRSKGATPPTPSLRIT
eukprot:9770059-Alexandrium_andersonii.AAC.1